MRDWQTWVSSVASSPRVGLTVTAAGLAIAYGRWGGLVLKAGLEERLLIKHFPVVYARYRPRVRARLIPFVM